MYEIKISNIRNVLFWGPKDSFKAEITELELAGNFNIFVAETSEIIDEIMNSNLIHLLIIEAEKGYQSVEKLVRHHQHINHATVPMLLAMKNEMVDERCDFFNLGVSYFYVKGNTYYFLEMINRIDRDMTFKEGLKNMSIAVLDDDRLQLAIVKDMLHRNQIHDVDFYNDPKSLLKVKRRYDIYLIDLILPEVDGEIVMLEMRKRYENAVIIGISSIEKKSTIARVLSIGANDYITKPLNEQVFLAKMYTNSRVLMLLKENEIKKKMLQELAIKDGLTNLYNHKHIHEILDNNVKLSKRYGRPLSLIMLDIDDFKIVNDTYGHQFGDLVLTKVSSIIKDSVRNSDIVGRYGGEEFIIILPETEGFDAMVLGNRIRTAVMEHDFPNQIKVTISGGVGQLFTSGEQLIYDADQLLYHAKHNGKNKIEYRSIKQNGMESYLTS
ncbi:MAG: diguanylate cyclase [Clostridia bacterium]|nr:diguanylate cyclase [Clostridia bacterium]